MLKQFVLRCAYRFHQETGLRLSHHVIPLCTDNGIGTRRVAFAGAAPCSRAAQTGDDSIKAETARVLHLQGLWSAILRSLSGRPRTHCN